MISEGVSTARQSVVQSIGRPGPKGMLGGKGCNLNSLQSTAVVELVKLEDFHDAFCLLKTSCGP